MTPIDVGLSLAESTAQQSARDIRTGDFIVGGSGGTNKTPGWVWIALGLVGLMVAFKLLFPSKR